MIDYALNYKDICLIPPSKCLVTSRSECDTSIVFLGKCFKLPVVPANMVAVINDDIAKWLSFNRYFYIMHRFGNNLEFIKRANEENWPTISISIGVKPDDEATIKYIIKNNYRVDFVTIDIAHGFSDSVADMISWLKDVLPEAKVIAGNVWGDRESIEFIQKSGADAIKVGLSCGKGCFLGDTKIMTQNGFKSIKDVVVGDKVKTHTGSFKSVVDRLVEKSDDLININGQICTSDHKFYVIDVTNDNIDDTYIEKHAYWIEACKISVKNHLIITLDQ